MKKTHKKNLIIIIFAATFMLLLSVGSFVKPDVSFSPNENRYFQATPKFSVKNVLSGKFEEQFEDYLSDQVILRNTWIKIKSRAEYLAGIRDINGVYVCKSGRIIEKVSEEDFNWDRYESNLHAVENLMWSLNGTGKCFRVMLVPTAQSIYSDELPKNALVFDEAKAYEMAESYFDDFLINITDDMKKVLTIEPEHRKTHNLYYYTDHHWTDEGVRVGYKAFNKSKGLSKNYTVTLETLTDKFHGTLYSKVLMNEKVYDKIDAPKAAIEKRVHVTLDNVEADSIFFMDKLENKDKYEVFFGGNYGRVDIEQLTDIAEPHSLLIVKDSYANSFVPYLLDDYTEITMVDTRYYRGSIIDLADEYDEILVLYSINNFAGEKILIN